MNSKFLLMSLSTNSTVMFIFHIFNKTFFNDSIFAFFYQIAEHFNLALHVGSPEKLQEFWAEVEERMCRHFRYVLDKHEIEAGKFNKDNVWWKKLVDAPTVFLFLSTQLNINFSESSVAAVLKAKRVTGFTWLDVLAIAPRPRVTHNSIFTSALRLIMAASALPDNELPSKIAIFKRAADRIKLGISRAPSCPLLNRFAQLFFHLLSLIKKFFVVCSHSCTLCSQG